MKFALVENRLVLASCNEVGICPLCKLEVFANFLGTDMYVWAHRGRGKCAFSWEPETIWHRSWKDCFPVEWQEVSNSPSTGRPLRLDIRSATGMVVELQHRKIRPFERENREQQFEQMIWIVDGNRLSSDQKRIRQQMLSGGEIKSGEIILTPYPDRYFPKDWVSSRAPVIFDFGHKLNSESPDHHLNDRLIYLMPGRTHARAAFFALERSTLIDIIGGKGLIVDGAEIFQAVKAHSENSAGSLERFSFQALMS